MLIIRNFTHTQRYKLIAQNMSEVVLEKINNPQLPDEIWFLEHEKVFTLGQAGKLEHILTPESSHHIPIIRSDRGGQITYHGEGQLIAYLILNLKAQNLQVRDLVRKIEKSIIDTLCDLNVPQAHAREGMPGVFIQENEANQTANNFKKIASLGLRVKRHHCYHGLSLNVKMDLSPFSYINPCGYEKLKMCQISDFIPNIQQNLVRDKLTEKLIQNIYQASPKIQIIEENKKY